MSLRQFPDRLKCGSCSLGIEIDKNIVEDDGQRIDMSGIVAQKGEAHRQVELLGGSPAQQLRQEPDAVAALHLKVRAVERRDNASVPVFAHGSEES